MKKNFKSLEKELYVAPDIAVVEIEIEQNILESGSGVISDDAYVMEAEDW